MYSELIIDHFSEPSFVGDLDSYDIELEVGNSVCGDRVRIQMLCDNGVVKKVAFRAWGCATSIATADIFCSSIQGKSASQVSERSKADIEAMLGELDPSQYHCVHILEELHEKLADMMTENLAHDS